jgi:N-acylneuraminate cytidylyltransferase
MAWPQHISTRSQDLQKHYHDSGQLYWIKNTALINEKNIFSSNCGAIELSQKEAQDIDTIEDWENAELKYKLINGIL